MLKYTLGALAAAVILIGAAFVILVQVTGGDANSGSARTIIVSVSEDEVVPLDIQVKEGEIIDLQLNNKSALPRSLILTGDNVEQLPQAPGHEHEHAPVPAGTILIEAGAGLGDSAFVRFNAPGEYTLNAAFTGTYYPPAEIKVVVIE